MSVRCAVRAAVVLTMLATGVRGWGAVMSWLDLPGGPGEVSFMNISEESTTDPLPMYNQPTRGTNNRLIIRASNFDSYSDSGNPSDTTAGDLKMDICAPSGQRLTQVRIREYGSYSLTCAAGGTAVAQVFGDLHLEDEEWNWYDDSMTFTPPVPITLSTVGSKSGNFQGDVTIDLSDYNITYLYFEFKNVLQTSISGSATSFIEKRGAQQTILIDVWIPEPATLGLMAAGVLGVFRRRR